jgi:hypothetical protein
VTRRGPQGLPCPNLATIHNEAKSRNNERDDVQDYGQARHSETPANPVATLLCCGHVSVPFFRRPNRVSLQSRCDDGDDGRVSLSSGPPPWPRTRMRRSPRAQGRRTLQSAVWTVGHGNSRTYTATDTHWRDCATSMRRRSRSAATCIVRCSNGSYPCTPCAFATAARSHQARWPLATDSR